MKTFLNIIIVALIFTGTTQAQQTKIKVSEDTFIQAGPSAKIAMGEKYPKNIRIFKSNGTDKYSRTGLLKFKISKKIKTIMSVELHFPLLVYKKENNDGKFNLEVYGVENDKWDEYTVTWADGLEKGSLLGTTEVSQSLDNKKQFIKIELDVNEFKKLISSKKDRKITLALANSKFNNVSAMAPTKEQSSKNAAYLIIN